VPTFQRLYFEKLFSEKEDLFSKWEKAPLSNVSQNFQKFSLPRSSPLSDSNAHRVLSLDGAIISRRDINRWILKAVLNTHLDTLLTV
jgi:hypothetical protein